MITFNNENKTFYIETNNTSYVFSISEYNTLEHLYYGKKIPKDDLKSISNRQIYTCVPHEKREDRAFVASTILQEDSVFNGGDFRTPSTILSLGENYAEAKFRYVSHTIKVGRDELKNLPYSRNSSSCQSLEVVLQNDDGSILISLHYVCYENTDVLARYKTIKNLSNNLVKIEKSSSLCLDFYTSNFDIITLEGMYLCERANVQRTPVRKGICATESIVGATSHHANPFMALCSPTATESQGEVYGFNLLYSGNFKNEVQVDRLGNTRVVTGINDATFSWSLASGEEFTTPEAVLTFSENGLGGMSRAFHDHIRENIIEPQFAYARRPIVVNSWEAAYFGVTEELILSLADRAKLAGIDTVVLDDGWFRNGISTGLGEWEEDKTKFPNGLKGLSEKIHKKGLKFGIWIEPEMISMTSKRISNGKDILSNAKSPLLSREQYVLDLTTEENVLKCVEPIFKALDGVGMDYVKWDYNRYICEGNSQSCAYGETYHKQVLGTYRLLSLVKERYPNAMIETCAGGGGRFDLGMLFYSPQIWTSDNTDPYARIYIQYGTSLAYPVSSISCHFSEGVCTSGRPSSYEFRYLVASFGAYGYELDLSKYPDEEIAKFKAYSEAYEEYSKYLSNGDMYRLISPETDEFCAWMQVEKDKSSACLTFLEINTTGFTESTTLRPEGLAPDKKYKNSQTGEVLYGSTLMNVGIRIGNLFKEKGGSGRRIIFEQVKD